MYAREVQRGLLRDGWGIRRREEGLTGYREGGENSRPYISLSALIPTRYQQLYIYLLIFLSLLWSFTHTNTHSSLYTVLAFLKQHISSL